MKSMNLIALMLVTSLLLVVPLAWNQGGNAERQAQARPDYCPLPDKLEFDYNTPQRDRIGIWTGHWKDSPGRGFCIVITSIQGEEVRGLFSYEDLGSAYGGMYQGGFDVFTGKIKFSRSAETITAKTAGSEIRNITLSFRVNGTVVATVHRQTMRQVSEAEAVKVN
jgi:hypothetical protein